MRRLIPLVFVLLCLPQAKAQSYGESSGWCVTGAIQALVQGLKSTNTLQGVIPSCTVTVYIHGTQTLATLFLNSTGTPQDNPFTASNTGWWTFYAANNAQYDVIGSGGIPPNTYVTPTIISSGSGGGGGGSNPPQYSVQFAANTNGAFGSDPNITINPTAHSFTVAGAGTGLISLGDASTTHTVSQTVQAGTATWTWYWPTGAPNAYNPCLISSTGGIGSFQGCASGFSPSPTIASAVTAAGQVGPLIIPGNYPGTDAFTNPNNLAVIDVRPHNPTNAATLVNPIIEPQTTIKATDYGAKCDGNNDDTAAINAAVSALTTITGGSIVPSHPPSGPGTVELPQGTCIVRAPIVISTWGSLVGNANGTWLGAAEPFTCNTFGCDIVQVTVPYPQPSAGLARTINRVVKNINFVYGATTTAITGVHIFNQTGATSATPYPYGSSASSYQIPGVIVADDSFTQMDTGVRVDDCGECHVDRSQFSFLRIGIQEYGNDFSFSAIDDAFEDGTGTYTPTTGQATNGFFAGGRTGNFCSNSGCTGTSTSVIFPQGCQLADSTMAGWDNDVNIPNCQGLGLQDDGFDYGSDGALSSVNSTVVIGPTVLIASITGNFIANNNCAGAGLEIKAPTANAAATPEFYNDLLIDGNYFTSYCGSTPSASAIIFDSGNFYRRGVKVVNNTIYDYGYGISALHGLQYSVIRGNYATNMSGTGALINLNPGSPSSTSFLGTSIADNTVGQSILAVYEQAGSGYILGSNQSAPGPAYQLTGNQSGTVAGCTITSGAIGNACGSAAVLTWPQAFGDSSYYPQCSVIGATGNVTAVVTSVSSSGVSVTEVALSTSATGGGTIVCSANHS